MSFLSKHHGSPQHPYSSLGLLLKHPSLSVLDGHCVGIQLPMTLANSLDWDNLTSLSAHRRLKRRYNSQPRKYPVKYMAHCGDCSNDPRHVLLTSSYFQLTMCTITVRDIICLSWCTYKADSMEILLHDTRPDLAGCFAAVIN